MATKFLTNLDLVQNQILNGTFEKVSVDPTSGTFEGWMIYRSDLDVVKYYSGSAWKTLINSVGSAGANTGAITITNNSDGTVSITLNLADAEAAGLLSSTFFSLLNGATSSSTGSTLAKRDADGRLQVAAPSADLDAANKAYVDAARSGLDVKQSVRAATTGQINLAGDLENGDVIDGVTLATGNRVLVKNQSTASQNGIYVVQASDAAVRATDFDGAGEVSGGAFTFVEEGTAHADSGWVVSSNGAITVGTDAINWVQFSGAGQITAGAGLTKTGNTIDAVGTADRITVNSDNIDIASTYAGQNTITTLGTIGTGTWEATDVGVAHGGTGASTAGDARTNIAAGGTQGAGVSAPVLSRTVALTIGDGTNTSYTVQHGFGTRDVTVQVYDTGAAPTYETVITDVVRTDRNNVTVSFSSIPASNSYRVVVTG
jgi:hypothetical protein